jgi:hypothetical protein
VSRTCRRRVGVEARDYLCYMEKDARFAVLGMTPMARSKLGLRLVQASAAAEDAEASRAAGERSSGCGLCRRAPPPRTQRQAGPPVSGSTGASQG